VAVLVGFATDFVGVLEDSAESSSSSVAVLVGFAADSVCLPLVAVLVGSSSVSVGSFSVAGLESFFEDSVESSLSSVAALVGFAADSVESSLTVVLVAWSSSRAALSESQTLPSELSHSSFLLVAVCVTLLLAVAVR
jgi:hypothetical protein